MSAPVLFLPLQHNHVGKGERGMKLRKRQTFSITIGIVLGTFLALIISLCGAAILTKMVLIGKIGERAINVGCKLIIAIGTLIGSVLSSLLVKEKKFLAAIATGTAVFVMLISCNALVLGGQYRGVPTTFFATIGTSALIGVIISKKKGHSTKQIKKYRFV